MMAGMPPGGGTRAARRAEITAIVSEVTGLGEDEISAALESGKSLTEVAESAGVSRQDLIDALVAGAPADAPGDIEVKVSEMVDLLGDTRFSSTSAAEFLGLLFDETG